MYRQIIKGFPINQGSDESDSDDCDYEYEEVDDMDETQDTAADEDSGSDTTDTAHALGDELDRGLDSVLQKDPGCFSHWMQTGFMTPRSSHQVHQQRSSSPPQDDDGDTATVAAVIEYDRPVSPTTMTQINTQLKKLEDDLASKVVRPRRTSLRTGPLQYHALNKQLQSVLPTIHGSLRILNRGALYTLGRYRTYIMSSNAIFEHSMALEKSSTGHPVLIARELIQLAVCLQLMVAENGSSSMGLSGVTPLEMADRYFDIAHSLVTSHDAMIKSQEGLECMFLEAYYQANKGNVRGSWMVVRRGIYIAQQMGLPPPSWQGHPISMHSAWTSILFAERFLSLMLGVPPYIIDDPHRTSLVPYVAAAGTIAPDPLATASIDLKRLQALIIPRISARNERLNQFAHPALCGTEQHHLAIHQDYQETRDIDYSFQRVSQTLPTKWWAMPNIVGGGLKWAQEVEETTRLMTQAKHYNLLVLLHLPYLTVRRPGILPTRPPIQDKGKKTAPGYYPHEYVIPPVQPEQDEQRPRSNGTNFREFDAAIHLNYTRPPVSEDLAAAFGIRPGEAAASAKPVPQIEQLPPWNALCMMAPPPALPTTVPLSAPLPTSSQPPDMTFSRLGALGAAREVLCRFLVFRHCTKITARCHAFDFEAFVACTAVLLAHLDTHTRGRYRNDNTTHYQRPTDINTVEQSLEYMEQVGAEMKNEAGCTSRVSVLRRLMAIEAEAALGANFDVWTEEGTLGRGDGQMTDDAQSAVQTLSIPYYGLLHIRRM